MAWFNPFSWGKKKEVVTATTTTAPIYSTTSVHYDDKTSETITKEVTPSRTFRGGGGSVSPVSSTGKIDTGFISGGVSVFDVGTAQPQKTISQQFITSGEQRPVTPEYGFLTLTEKEFEKHGTPSQPFRVVGDKLDVEKAVFMGRTQLPPQIFGGGFFPGVHPSGTLQESQTRIETSGLMFEKFRGISKQFKDDPKSFIGKEGVLFDETTERVTLTPGYFDSQIDYGFLRDKGSDIARMKLEQRPTGDIIKSRLLGVGVGGGQTLIGVGEFGLSQFGRLGFQTSVDGKFESSNVYFKGTLGNIMQQPKGTGEYLGMATIVLPAVTAGAFQFKSTIGQVGFKGAVVETAGMFSPIQIRPGVFTTKLSSDTKIDITSFKLTKEGITGRAIYGKGVADDVTIISKQFTTGLGTKQTGIETTSVYTPATSYRVGAGFKDYTRVTSFKGFIGGESGKAFIGGDGISRVSLGEYGFTGFAGKSYMQPTSDIFIETFPKAGKEVGIRGGFGEVFAPSKQFRISKVGGFGVDVQEGAFQFVAGKYKPVYKWRFEGDLNVWEPTGKIRITKPTIKGFEYDLSKFKGFDIGISVKDISQGTLIGSKGGQMGLIKQVSQIQTAVSHLPPSPSLVSTTTTIPSITSISSISSLTSKQKGFSVTLPKVSTTLKDKIVISSIISSSLKPTTRTKQISGLMAGLGSKTITIPKRKIKLGEVLLQQSKLKTKQTQSFKSMFAPTTLTTSTLSPTFTTRWATPIPLPIIPTLGGAKGKKKKKKKGKKATRKTKYVSTLAAQTYGLTAPTIPESYYIGAGGLGGRPKIVKKKTKSKRRKK